MGICFASDKKNRRNNKREGNNSSHKIQKNNERPIDENKMIESNNKNELNEYKKKDNISNLNNVNKNGDNKEKESLYEDELEECKNYKTELLYKNPEIINSKKSDNIGNIGNNINNKI